MQAIGTDPRIGHAALMTSHPVGPTVRIVVNPALPLGEASGWTEIRAMVNRRRAGKSMSS